MNNKSVKEITIAAMFGALYGVLLSFVRFFFSGSDSLIYYFLPLPLALYSYWKKGSYSGSLLVIASILAFLIVDPIRAGTLIVPNLIIGFITGILLRKNFGFFKIFIVFILCLLADFLSLYAFELLTGVSFFESTIEEFSEIFKVSEVVLRNIVMIALPVVLIIESLMKCVLMLLVLKILTVVLKFKEIKPIQIKLNLGLNKLYSFLFLGILIPFLLITFLIRPDYNKTYVIFIYIIIIAFLIILSLIIYFNTTIYLRYYLSYTNNFFNKHPFILALLCLVLFPFVIVFGIILNLFTTKAYLKLANNKNLR